MTFSIKPFSKLSLFASLFTVVVLFASCRDDDDGGGGPLTYNPMEHIYGITNASFSSGEWWQIIIDPQTGAYDTVPGSAHSNVLSFPSGVKNLIDFAGNRRVYWQHNESRLIIQDLETLASTAIEVKDPVSGNFVLNPQFFTFGASTDIVYIFSVDEELWSVELSTGTVAIVYDDLPFDNVTVDNQLYLPSSNQLIYGAHVGNDNLYVSTMLFALDVATGELSELGEVPESFGWVTDPQNENIYGLTLPTDDRGFRLLRLDITNGAVEADILSSEDLAIDNLSFHAQTIHRATNTYICRGGSGQEGMLTNDVYSIDLNNGDLINTISINEVNGEQMTIIDLLGE